MIACNVDFGIIVNFTKETIKQMESKLNKEALREFGNRFSESVSAEFFKNRSTITGHQILNLTEIRQINLFIISKILDQWNVESSKLRSEYFNYDKPEVKKALNDFMNTLSQNIEIEKNIFEPLMVQSTEEAILLICSPYEFYIELVKKRDPVSVKDLKAFSKFVKINRDLFLSFVNQMEKGGKDIYQLDEAMELLNHLFENTTNSPEEIEPYIKKLSKVIEFPMGEIYGTDGVTENISKEIKQEQKTQNSKIEYKTLNDHLANENITVLAGIQKKKIDSIKNHLSINQKFIFINQLFDGNSNDFNSVINFLDGCSSQGEAMDFIHNNYLKKNNWKKDNQEVKDFIEMIARKYT